MERFVKAIEVWAPSSENLVLELTSSFYGHLKDFKKTSEVMSFPFDHGLPGKTWAAGHPLVLSDLDNSYFLRAKEAKLANITCCISVPVYSGEFLQAVVVLFCGGGKDVAGALELWHQPDKNGQKELRLVDGYYGELKEFEWLSRRISIMYSRGLPGKAWSDNQPVLIQDIGSSDSFLRASHAAEAGITTGLAMPIHLPDSQVQILTFLSAKGTPIARRFEIWMPTEDRSCLKFHAGKCELETDLTARYTDTVVQKGKGPMGIAWLTGRPMVADLPSEEGDAIVVLPTLNNGFLESVVCLIL